MVWSKAFVMEKYRYDGADVAHLLLRQGASLDWKRLLRRFGRHWRVLLSHLVLFEFIYPGQRVVPPALVCGAASPRVTRENGELQAERRVPGRAAVAQAVPRRHRELGAARRAARLGRRDEPRGHRRVDAGRPRAAGSGRLTMRIAAVGDVHCSKKSEGQLQALFAEAGARADVLLLCGDLTAPRAARRGARCWCASSRPRACPSLAVLGNHDFESNEVEALVRVLEEGGVNVLDGETWEKDDVGFAGVKGFGGGFGESSLAPWGEPVLKAFVQEATQESLKLERALASLRTRRRVAFMHYAPIVATVAGEPLEIQPFLGSGRLEEPLDRYHVDVTFHGHAHRGSLEGRTRGGCPVYNVALPLLQGEGRGAVAARTRSRGARARRGIARRRDDRLRPRRKPCSVSTPVAVAARTASSARAAGTARKSAPRGRPSVRPAAAARPPRLPVTAAGRQASREACRRAARRQRLVPKTSSTALASAIAIVGTSPRRYCVDHPSAPERHPADDARPEGERHRHAGVVERVVAHAAIGAEAPSAVRSYAAAARSVARRSLRVAFPAALPTACPAFTPRPPPARRASLASLSQSGRSGSSARMVHVLLLAESVRHVALPRQRSSCFERARSTRRQASRTASRARSHASPAFHSLRSHPLRS